jgi:4-amino-4-deoxy-L-arabinose transferase-like glycosyltransferase
VLTLIRRHRWWFAGIALAAVLLRLFFTWRFAIVTDDAVYYADIAKCLLQYHGYGTTQAEGWTPTLSRLPGYPAFLAFTFLLGGEDNFRPAMLFQLGFDLLTCLLVADVARRVFGEMAWGDRAARWAFLLAAFCPFLMNYVATPLTECLELFFIAAALDCAVIALGHLQGSSSLGAPLLPSVGRNGNGGKLWWVLCGIASAGATLLRPDGGLILVGIGLPLVVLGWCNAARRRELWTATLVLFAVALSPLVPWTIRNWRVFHVFQPLVNTHASDPGAFVPLGWERWMKTWLIDYASMEDVGFHVDGSALDPDGIPARACNSEADRQQLRRLIGEYNRGGYQMTPELDRQFAALAAESIRLHPLRYYLLLPLARTLDMWLRPRSEMMPLDTHFWSFAEDPHDSLCAISLAALNLFYVAAAVAGAWLLRRRIPGVFLGLLLTYPVVRSLFLATTGAAEDRYTLECFPFVFVLAAGFLSWWERRGKDSGREAALPG